MVPPPPGMVPPPPGMVPPPPGMVPPPENVVTRTIPFICPYCGTYADVDADLEGKDYECQGCAEVSTAVVATERVCPFCGETVKFKAQICRFCRKQLPPMSQRMSNPGGIPPGQMIGNGLDKLKFWKK